MLEVGERVDVIAAFRKDRRLKPLKFRWSDRQINIREVTYEWTTLEGKNRLFHFSVTDGRTLYELSFDTGSAIWRLEGIETEI